MTYRPTFGGIRCWFTQRIALLTYFGLPIAISIMLNICLYTLTSLNLRRAFKDKKSRKTQQNEQHFLVYVRLFVLMGFTWIFGFLSAFTDEVAIDFVFVILTSLQGVFLFVSFVCNKRVLNELKKKTNMGKTSNHKSFDTPLAKRDTSQDSHERDTPEHSSENMHEIDENERKLMTERKKGKQMLCRRNVTLYSEFKWSQVLWTYAYFISFVWTYHVICTVCSVCRLVPVIHWIM